MCSTFYLSETIFQTRRDLLSQADGAAEPQVVEGRQDVIEETGQRLEVQQGHGGLQGAWLGAWGYWGYCSSQRRGQGDERVQVHVLLELVDCLLHCLAEILCGHALEHGRQLPAKVSPHPAEGQAEVHALAEEGVQSAAHASLKVALQSLQELSDLLHHPAVEDGGLVHGEQAAGSRGHQRVLVGEDGPVLGDDVEEVDPAGLDGLGDVEVGVLFGDGGEDGLQPGAARLQELHPQLRLREHVHPAQVANDAQADGKLRVAAELLQQLVEHELSGLTHLRHDSLGGGMKILIMDLIFGAIYYKLNYYKVPNSR